MYDGLFVYADQDRDQPKGVPNIHGMYHYIHRGNLNCALILKSLPMLYLA